MSTLPVKFRKSITSNSCEMSTLSVKFRKSSKKKTCGKLKIDTKTQVEPNFYVFCGEQCENVIVYF